jgi:signal recognition particle GTPase
VASAILAETHASPLWDWPEASNFHSVYAETGEAVDDLLVTNSLGARAYVQAKLRLALSEDAESPLAAALSQFVDQWLSDSPTSEDDRLVLATGPESSGAIRDVLPRVLARLRRLSADAALKDAATNEEEERVLRVVRTHVERSWSARTGAAPTEDELRRLLSIVRLSVHDLYDDGASVREATGLLRSSILQEPGEAGAVWAQLIALTNSFSVQQTGADLAWLQAELAKNGVGLKAAPSFRDDIGKLRRHSAQSTERLEQFSTVRDANDAPVKIARSALGSLRAAAEQRSVIVTGDPGAGKSASLFELASGLAGRDVVVLAADTLAAGSLGQLRAELGLERDIVEVLQNWPGAEPAVLIVDALDAARGDRTQEALLDLIGAVARYAPRWRVVASVRRFDLRYNMDLKALFASSSPAAPAEFQTAEFSDLSHFHVPLLTDEELAQLKELADELAATIAAASPDLRELIRVPFNLRLLADLVSIGVARAELEPISTQLQLLEKYWEHRILRSDAGGDALEAVLRLACTEMIAARALRVDRAALQRDPSYAAPLAELLSKHVLAEEQSGDGAVRREVLSFSHNVLFDYAVARLLLRRDHHALVSLTREQPELLLIVRPSYELHLRYVWESGQ